MRRLAASIVLWAAFLGVTFPAYVHAQRPVPPQAQRRPQEFRILVEDREFNGRARILVIEENERVQILAIENIEDNGIRAVLLNDFDGSNFREQLRTFAGSVAASVRASMRHTLNEELTAISSLLTDAQKKKLRLAGEGDITKILRQIDELELLHSDASVNRSQFQDVALTLSKIELLGKSYRFGEESLFQKTMRKTLSDEQFHGIRRAKQAVVVAKALQIVSFTDKPFELTDGQRQQVTEILLDGANPPSQLGNYGHYVVLYHAAKLEVPLKRVLNPNQWEVFQDRIAYARRTVPDLRRKGLLPEFQDENAPADVTRR